MDEDVFLISNPSAMEWLMGLAILVFFGFVGVFIVWRTARIYKIFRDKSKNKEK